MSEGWEEKWEIIKDVVGEGGQGTVSQVRKKSNGTLGALKRLHKRNLKSTERRFRMLVEVSAIRALEGNRTPSVLEANVSLWQERPRPLYVVMEWIEGIRLSEYVRGAPISLDDTLVATSALLETIEACHALDIYHRDLKPDNIMLRQANIAEPILVDFGMAWAKPPEDESVDSITEAGDEIGNRFLRLPEHAADRHIRDPRSDLTVLVGLLLYMITGKQPRVLADANRRMPHQFLADRIPREVTEDARWPILERLFRIGFQADIDLRFQSSNQLREFIERLNNPGSQQDQEMLDLEVARINDLLNSPQFVLPKQAKKVMPKAMAAMTKVFLTEAQKAGFAQNFSSSFIEQPDLVGTNDLFGIYKSDVQNPGVQGDHQTRLEGNMYVAYYRVEPFERVEYYRGSAVDPESLEDAVRGIVPRILKDLIRVYYDRLKERYKVP
jgi:serine/threonine-protein kinase